MDTDTTRSGTTHTGHVAGHDRAVVSRRDFLSKLSLGLSAIFGALVGLPVIGFLVAPLLRRAPERWQPVRAGGEQIVGVDDFEVGETKLVTFEDPSPLPWAGIVARSAAWVRRENDRQFVAFAVNCTHLGCPVRWVPDGKIFMCPCHGGVFYQDGEVAAGPPPRPLFRYRVRVQNGRVELLVGTLPVAAE